MSDFENLLQLRPSFYADFARGMQVPPAVSGVRPSLGSYHDAVGRLRTAPPNGPRVDWDPATGECLGLLLEIGTSNSVSDSENFTAASWSRTGSAIAPSSVVGPKGTAMSKLVEQASSGGHYIFVNAIAVTSGQTCTISIYVKAGERSKFMLLGYNGTDNVVGYFDLNTGSATGGILQSVGRGIYRASVTYTPKTTTNAPYSYQIYMCNPAGDSSYTGDGSSGLYLFGAQHEVGDIATSYIPTSGGPASRASDAFGLTGAPFNQRFNPDAGTVLICAEHAVSRTGWSRYVSLSDGSVNNELSFVHHGPVNGELGLVLRLGGDALVDMLLSRPAGSRFKAAIAYDATSCAIALDGQPPQLRAAPAAFAAAFTQLGMGSVQGGNPGTHIRAAHYFPRRLSNSELQQVTA